MYMCVYILYMYVCFVYVCIYYRGSTQYRLAFCVTPGMYMAKIDNIIFTALANFRAVLRVNNSLVRHVRPGSSWPRESLS